jgi:glycosyltransferase involved in cell wall biosynthesis
VVISNDVDNLAQYLINDGVNGSVVPPEPELIAQAVSYWLNFRPIEVKPCLDWDQQALKVEEVYRGRGRHGASR